MRWWVLAVLIGCTNELSLDEFGDQYIQRLCEWRTRCGVYGSADECIEYIGHGGDYLADVRAAVAADKIDFDSDAAAECLSVFDSLSCHRRVAVPECQHIFRGRLELGAECAFDHECESDACEITSCPDDACCEGTCRPPYPPPAMLGEPCNFDDDCDAELWCPISHGGTDSTCQPLPATGEACLGLGPCLEQSDTCRDDTHVCAHGAVDGEHCDTNFDCGELYYCSPDNVCVISIGNELGGLREPLGSTCMSNSDCASYTCDGVCVEAPICY
jgi:hypothetical protein